MNKNMSYHAENSMKCMMRLQTLLEELPVFAKSYFRAKEPQTSARTRLAYGYDLRTFFYFLTETNPIYEKKVISSFTLEDMEKLSVHDIEEFQDYLKCYQLHDKDGRIATNTTLGIARKISCLRSFFDYYVRIGELSKNPAALLIMPKINKKEIIQLDPDEIAILLDGIENGDGKMSVHQKKYLDKTRLRDLAIVTLLLGTGIRISECVGLDIQDVNFRDNSIKIIRKGGNEQLIYFGDEVACALDDYISGQRNLVIPESGSENALFLSMQNTRISADAIERMVVKYAKQFVPQKKITPHKLRSTYGTQLYQETGDLYLVSEVLGHQSVETSKRYAAMKNRKRMAANAVKLRE